MSYILLRSGVECGSPSTRVGSLSTTYASAQDCAEAVSDAGGVYFIFGHGIWQGLCWIENTATETCEEGFETHLYDFYKVVPIPIGQTATPTNAFPTQQPIRTLTTEDIKCVSI